MEKNILFWVKCLLQIMDYLNAVIKYMKTVWKGDYCYDIARKL